MGGCGVGGVIDETDYAKPLPWIGVYIAGGSLLCAAAMAYDACSGFRRRKLWFPTRLFSLNATTLTFLAIATKFPVDLNTSMPGRADQLSKLSGTVLICTVTANLMPSLGDMDDSEILSNVVALVILIMTVVVNVGIQMGTRVIFVFLPEHAVVMFLMMVLLVLLVSSALTASTTKNLLELQYLSKNQEIHSMEATDDIGNKFSLPKLKGHVKRYWLMAHSGSPQYVLGRSATCTAAGAFSLLGALVLTQAVLRALIRGPNVRFCSGTSDYEWSTTLVLVTQAAAVLIGTVAPACRWFYAVNFKSPSYKDEFKVEDYWVQRLKDWKEAPLPFDIRWNWLRKVAHDLYTFCLAILIRVQQGVIVASKLVRLLSVLPLSWLYMGCRRLRPPGDGELKPEDSELKPYVLHLEGEEDLAKLMAKSERKDTERWMQKGSNKPAKALEELIQKYSTISQGFIAVGAFNSAHGVPSLGPEEPPNCWALPLVTLTAIAVALPSIDKKEANTLLRGVSKGLRFVKLVETNLDEMGLVNMRGAAEIVWLGVDLHKKWLNQDLHSLVSSEGDGRKIVEKIAKAADVEVKEFVQDLPNKPVTSQHPLQWPERVLAANCMYRVCKTILQDYDDGKHPTDVDLFIWLRRAISDILGACLTNLPRAIHMECSGNRVEVREKAIRDAALSLGKTEAILQLLEACQAIPTQYIDDWPGGERVDA